MITLTFDKVSLVNEISHMVILSFLSNTSFNSYNSVTLTTGTALSNNSAIVRLRYHVLN